MASRNAQKRKTQKRKARQRVEELKAARALVAKHYPRASGRTVAIIARMVHREKQFVRDGVPMPFQFLGQTR